MRIELKYQSSCPSSRKVREHLEDIIAEERLPLAVELVESENSNSVIVRIHSAGKALLDPDQREIDCENHVKEEKQFLDNLRRVVLEKWHHHAVSPLSHLG